MVRYEQNQSWNIPEGIKKCFSKLWQYRRIYKIKKSANMQSKKEICGRANIFVYT